MQKKQRQPKEINRSIKFPWWITSGIITAYVVLALIPFGFVPDYLFGLEDAERVRLILRTILTVQGSILGLLFAAIILLFNVSRDMLGRSALVNLSSNNRLFNFVAVLILSIILSFISFFITKDVMTNNTINLTYFSAYLFVGLLIFLYPVLMSSFEGFGSLKRTQELCDQIDYEQMRSILNEQTEMPDIQRILEIEANPIFLLREIATKSLDQEDNLPVQHIFRQTILKGIDIIGTEDNRRKTGQVVQALNIIWNAIILKAIEKKNYQVLSFIWNGFSQFHDHFADKKLPLINLERHHDIFKEFIVKLEHNGLTGIIQTGLFKIEKAIIRHLRENCPPEDHISDVEWILGSGKYESKGGIGSNIQWQKIADDYPYLFDICLNLAIEHKNRELFNHTIFQLRYFLDDVESSEIEESKKHLMVVDIVGTICYYATTAIEKGLFEKSSSLHVLPSSDLYKMVENDKPYFKRCMSSYSDMAISLAKLNALDLGFYREINLGAIGRVVSEKFNQDIRFQEALFFVLDTMGKMREVFEEDLKIHGEKYLKLAKDIESCRQWAEKNGKKAPAALKKAVTKSLKQFKQRKEIQQEMEGGFVEWKTVKRKKKKGTNK